MERSLLIQLKEFNPEDPVLKYCSPEVVVLLCKIHKITELLLLRLWYDRLLKKKILITLRHNIVIKNYPCIDHYEDFRNLLFESATNLSIFTFAKKINGILDGTDIRQARFRPTTDIEKEAIKILENKKSRNKRFFSLERKLDQYLAVKSEYVKFLLDYEKLGYMERAHINLSSFSSEYFVLPHHGIWQQGTKGLKLRVVFDASAKSDNNVSLN